MNIYFLKTKIRRCLSALLISTVIIQFTSSQWVQQISSTNEYLQSVSFVDSLNGWVAGNRGIILHTTNGGDIWTQQYSNTNASLYSISFCDLNNGWAVGSLGTILRTTNGGISWNKVLHDTSSRIEHIKVQCFDSLNVIILRDSLAADYETSYRIWKTTNAGTTWSEISPGPQIYYNKLRDIYFLTPKIGWSCGLGLNSEGSLQGCQIHRTTNGGLSWESYWFNPPGFGWAVGKVFFEDTKNGWALDRDTVFRSSDGGVTWYSYSVSSYGFGWSTHFVIIDSVGYVTQGLQILKTIDKGLTWTRYQTGKSLYDLALTSQNNVWVVGGGGFILHTSNGGITSVNSKNIKPSFFELKQNYPNPFNPSTNIHFVLAYDSFVRLSVFDMLGREIDIIINKSLVKGEHEVQWNADKYSSGVYILRLINGDFPQTRKMTLIK